MPSIAGVSLISLVATDAAQLRAACTFYQKLGLRLTRSYTKANASGDIGPEYHLGVSGDSVQEVWLESFPLQDTDCNGCLVPWQELPIYTGDKSAKLAQLFVVKVRMGPRGGEEVGRRSGAGGENGDDDRKGEYSGAHAPSAGVTVAFFSTNMQKLRDVIPTESLGDNACTARDPLGNTLVFTCAETPFSDRHYSLPEEFLEHKHQEILAAMQPESARSPQKDSKPRKKVAVMTSGGDAPGMNPAVRAVVRAGIYFGCDVFAVYEGYEGLVQGGDLLRPMAWNDVRNYLSLGGTLIGTARSARFREREGRVLAAYNMIKNGIDALVVCGGDGSLTGADLFRLEWPLLTDELVESGRLTAAQVKPHKHLTIVGLVGSIDNDMAHTDATIGAYSSLERIAEMVDYIDATALSHSRAFVVEVMGRHCGWLGLMAGLATGADFIFIPERPPSAGKWRQELADACRRHREKGKRKTIVIVAEGAIDDQLNEISSGEVKQVLVDMGLDTRTTILGHVQRGGTAVAYDRMLATLQGVEAVRAVLESTPEVPSPMIGILENKIVRQPLMDAVSATKSVAEAIANKDFDRAMQLRDSQFADAYDNFLSITHHDDGLHLLPEAERLNIGIVHVGAPAAGLNSATRAAALYCLSKGHQPYAIQNGFSGFASGEPARRLEWIDVEGWHNRGGSEIGTNRSLPSEDFGSVAYYVQQYQLNGLIIIGGFEGFTALHQLQSNKHQYPVFNIPMVVVPATVSNNVPGTEYSLGSDTCLNQLVKYCDAVKQSASSSRRRVFVVEVQGGHSGYVASYCGLVTGLIATYTPESLINLRTLREDIRLLHQVFEDDRGEDHNGKMIVRNEQASSVYTAELIADILKEAAEGRFETRTAIPGHVQQGFGPSLVDRVNAVRLSVKAVQFIENWNTNLRAAGSALEVATMYKHTDQLLADKEAFPASGVVIGILGAKIEFTSIHALFENEADVKLRKGRSVHWGEMATAGDMLSGRLLLREGKRKR